MAPAPRDRTAAGIRAAGGGVTRFATSVYLATLRCEDCRVEYHDEETWTIQPGAAAYAMGDRGQAVNAWCMKCAIRHGWLLPRSRLSRRMIRSTEKRPPG